MSRASHTALLGALLLAGCGAFRLVPQVPTCTSDDQCAEGQVCFADGCGDPGRDLVVEITANTRTGQHAQDVAIPDGTLKASFDVELHPPMSLVGELQRDLQPDADPTQRTLYTEQVTMRAVGESTLIPGVVRTFEQTFPRPERGTYSMAIGAGRYTVTAIPQDVSVPPLARGQVTVVPGATAQASFAFPSIDGTLTIAGRLLERIEPGLPPLEIALTQAAMELEAVDPVAKRALSQRTFTSSGLTGSRGDFVLSIDPAAATLDSIQIVARPRDADALVPTKTFTLTRPYPSAVSLQMGAFGDALPGLAGVVRGADGLPVADATVVLEGPVSGGGTFRSKAVTTDAEGRFYANLLPSSDTGAYTLTVLPNAKSAAGILTASTRAVVKAGQPPALEPSVFTCPDRLQVHGGVVRPDGDPGRNTLVIATPVKAVQGRPLPRDPAEALADDQGRFQLDLDPAVYRLDFLPGEDFPRMSRFVEVKPPAGADGGGTGGHTVQLEDFELGRGRKLTGLVTSRPYPNQTQPEAVNATVRFFRVTTLDGKPSSLLVAEGVTSDRGIYTVVLPTR